MNTDGGQYVTNGFLKKPGADYEWIQNFLNQMEKFYPVVCPADVEYEYLESSPLAMEYIFTDGPLDIKHACLNDIGKVTYTPYSRIDNMNETKEKTKAPNPLPNTLPPGTIWRSGAYSFILESETSSFRKLDFLDDKPLGYHVVGAYSRLQRPELSGERFEKSPSGRTAVLPVGVDWDSYYKVVEKAFETQHTLCAHCKSPFEHSDKTRLTCSADCEAFRVKAEANKVDYMKRADIAYKDSTYKAGRDQDFDYGDMAKRKDPFGLDSRIAATKQHKADLDRKVKPKYPNTQDFSVFTKVTEWNI